jgi:hypothetical protein
MIGSLEKYDLSKSNRHRPLLTSKNYSQNSGPFFVKVNINTYQLKNKLMKRVGQAPNIRSLMEIWGSLKYQKRRIFIHYNER